MGGSNPARLFFDTLYPQGIPKNGVLHVRILVDPDRDIGTNRGATQIVRNFKALDDLPDEFPQDAHIFFGVGIRAETNPKRHVAMWTAFFADLDSAAEFEPPDENFPLPTITVRSGRGLHLYWLLRSPVFDIEEYRRYLRAIYLRIGGDPGASDPQRLLRIPFTRNVKYEGAPLSEVVEIRPERVYDLEDFGAPESAVPDDEVPDDLIEPVAVDYTTARFPAEQEYLRRFAWEGWKPEHLQTDPKLKSHSHLLYHIARALAREGHTKGEVKGFLFACPRMIREKERARERDKVDRAIHRAFAHLEEEQANASAATAAGLVDDKGVLRRATAKGETVGPIIANFRARPRAVFNQHKDGGYMVTCVSIRNARPYTFFLPTDTLKSASSLKGYLPPEFEFHGNNADVSRFQAYLNEWRATQKEPTYTLGWYKGRNGAWEHLVATATAYEYRAKAESCPLQYVGDKQWHLAWPGEDWRARAGAAIELLLQLHEPHVVWALLGWVMTTFIAPRLREVRFGTEVTYGEFSGLWLWGRQGSGKSLTAQQFLRLTAAPRDFMELSSESTIVYFQQCMAASNTLPVFIDDPRKIAPNETEKKRLYSVLRGVFNGMGVGRSARAAEYMTGKQRFLLAPTLVASEQTVTDDEAMEERYLYVPFHKEQLSRQGQVALTALTMEPLHELALGFYWHFWDMDVAKAWKTAYDQTAFLREKGEHERPRKAIAQVLLGLAMARDVHPGLALPPMADIAETLWTQAWVSTGSEAGQAGDKSFSKLVDSMFNLIAEQELVEGQDFMVRGDVLIMQVNRLRHVIAKQRATGGLGFTEEVIHQTLQGQAGQAVFYPTRERFPGSQTNIARCATFRLDRLKAMGFTEEPWYNVTQVVA